MATPTRIYLVTDRDSADGAQHLVRASTPAAAISAVVGARFGAQVATQETIVEMMSIGAKVRDARDDG